MASSSEQQDTLLPRGRSASVSTPEQDSARTKYAWLTLYFSLNLALTLYNKAVMGKVNGHR